MRETFKKDYYRMTGTKFSLFRFLFSYITEHGTQSELCLYIQKVTMY